MRPSFLVLVVLAACASERSTPEPPPPAAATAGAEQPAKRGGMQVEGILGTIPQRKIEGTLQAKMKAFQRCFFDGSADVEMIGGHIKFYFRVGLDGRVEYVHPRGSSIGHRPTELCLLARARETKFPEPKGGGPAEFVWGFEIEPSDGVRAAVTWPSERVQAAVSEHQAQLAECTNGGHFKVTLYVSPGGRVLAAGAAADSQPAAERIDCIVDAVKAWQLPDPGSYPAKVTFEL